MNGARDGRLGNVSMKGIACASAKLWPPESRERKSGSESYLDDFGLITGSVDLHDSTPRGDVREEHRGEGSPLGSHHLLMESNNILKGGHRS